MSSKSSIDSFHMVDLLSQFSIIVYGNLLVLLNTGVHVCMCVLRGTVVMASN